MVSDEDGGENEREEKQLDFMPSEMASLFVCARLPASVLLFVSSSLVSTRFLSRLAVFLSRALLCVACVCGLVHLVPFAHMAHGSSGGNSFFSLFFFNAPIKPHARTHKASKKCVKATGESVTWALRFKFVNKCEIGYRRVGTVALRFKSLARVPPRDNECTEPEKDDLFSAVGVRCRAVEAQSWPMVVTSAEWQTIFASVFLNFSGEGESKGMRTVLRSRITRVKQETHRCTGS